MKILKYLIPFLAVSLNAQTLTIEKVYELAQQNYPLIKRNDLITKTKQYTVENAMKGWLPQIQIIGQASYQSEVTRIPIEIPNMNIVHPARDQYKIYADVQQNIYDGGVISNQKKLAEVQGKADLQKNQVELDNLKQRINQIYFGILQTDEQMNALDLSKTDIDNALKRAEVQLANGVILRSNVDLLKAEKIGLDQKRLELQTVRKSFLDMLSIFINQKLGDTTSLRKPEATLLTQQNNRAELKLFDIQKEALDLQKKMVLAKNLPKLGAFLQAGYGRPGLNMLSNQFDTYAIGGIRLNIPISGFYTYRNELSLIENQKNELEIQRENFIFNQNLQNLQNNNELQKIQNLMDKDDELIALRESIKKANLAQLENGVITTSDYLRSVNAAEQAKLQKTQHEIQFLLNQYNLKAQLNN